MIRKSAAPLFAVLLIFSSLSNSQHAAKSQELLIAVSGGEENRVARANDYFLRKEGYFAKRFRIVRVNTDLLLGDVESFTITLFEGRMLPATRQSVEFGEWNATFIWSGNQSSVPFSAMDIATSNPSLTEKAANDIYENLTGFSVFGTQFVFDGKPELAEEVAGMRRDPNTGRIYHNRERLAGKLNRGTTVYSTRFDIRLVSNESLAGTEYQLRPLPMDRRYSVLYEIDPNKIFEVPRDQPASPEIQERYQLYRDFVDSLGDDPRQAVQTMERQQ